MYLIIFYLHFAVAAAGPWHAPSQLYTEGCVGFFNISLSYPTSLNTKCGGHSFIIFRAFIQFPLKKLAIQYWGSFKINAKEWSVGELWTQATKCYQSYL